MKTTPQKRIFYKVNLKIKKKCIFYLHIKIIVVYLMYQKQINNLNNKIMKTSDLIKKLQSLQEKHGDNELHFSVKDYYSRYGERMNTFLRCGETNGFPTDWQDVYSAEGHTTIFFHIENDYDGKKPKITFRK